MVARYRRLEGLLAKIPVKPYLLESTSCAHGGVPEAELRACGLSPAEVYDFSVNCNPYGPPPSVRQAIAEVAMERYPDGQAERLRVALAGWHGLSAQEVVAGNGSAELIYLLCRAGLDEGDRVLAVGPTFSEYERGAHAVGARFEMYRAPGPSFRPDIEAVGARIAEWQPRLVFLCNPNNPTGVYLGRLEVKALASACEEGLLVLDEAYAPFVAEAWAPEPLLRLGNVVILRSLTKDLALAGVRLGYALMPSTIARALLSAQPPWSVNGFAQAAGLAAVAERDYVARCRGLMLAEARRLREAIAGMGWPVVPSMTNFFLVRVGDAAGVARALLRRGVAVRDCTSFGLGEYIRVAARTPSEGDRLLQAMAEVRESA